MTIRIVLLLIALVVSIPEFGPYPGTRRSAAAMAAADAANMSALGNGWVLERATLSWGRAVFEDYSDGRAWSRPAVARASYRKGGRVAVVERRLLVAAD
jgi:hypothetical protein